MFLDLIEDTPDSSARAARLGQGAARA